MSQQVHVAVGGDASVLVRAALLTVYASRATQVGDLAGIAPPGELDDARRELARVEQMLDVLGWDELTPSAGAELCGPEALVGEVLRLALSDACDAVASSLEGYHRGAIELQAIHASLETLRGLVARFAAFEREHAL
jgi:hypothetical protein